MSLSFKLLFAVFLVAVVGIFATPSDTSLIAQEFPTTTLSDSTLRVNTLHNSLPNKQLAAENSPGLAKNKPFDSAAQTSTPLTNTHSFIVNVTNLLDDLFATNIVAQVEDDENLDPPVANGIDGTGGTQSQNAGIDGTGATPPQDTGIDGTGGSDLPTNKGLDGTGGPEPLTIAPVEATGILQRHNGRFIVNGISFRVTDDTNTTIDGDSSAEASTLNDGQVVVVNGPVDDNNNGIANQVIYTTHVSGEITNITSDSISVLGQTVTLEHEVIFGGVATQIHDLRIGDIVNVSGFIRSNGDLSATRIDQIQTRADRLTGSISALNEANSTFVVNQLTVDYSQIELPPGLTNGMTVNIQGAIDGSNPLRLNAATINLIESAANRGIDRVEIEGFITEFSNASHFSIGNTVVYTDLQTEIVGNDRDDLALNVKVEVEGYLDDNNTLVAERVIFLVANITSHADKSALSYSTETFQWTDVNADAYRLIVQDDLKTHYSQTFDGSITSAAVDNLAENTARIRVSLYTLQGTFWSRKVYDFYGSGDLTDATLTSHTNGDSLKGTTETFTWNHAPDADSYRIRIHNYYSNIDYFDQTFTKPEDITLHNLPSNGADINIALFTEHNGWWSRIPYTLKSVQLVKNATFTSHTDKQALKSSTETFTWEDVGAEQYEIRVAKRLPISGYQTLDTIQLDGSITSITLRDLPINKGEVFIRLRTKHSGWATKYYRFPGTGEVAEAKLESHKNRDVLSSTTSKFSWSKVPEAQEYKLVLSNASIDGSVLFSENYNNFVTSQTISDLPKNGAIIQFQLYTLVNGFWGQQVYGLQGTGEIPDTHITSHNESEPITSNSTTITWSDVGASAYNISVVDVSTTPSTKLLDQRYGPETTSTVINNLSNNSRIRISVHSKHGNWWGGNNITVSVKIP